MKNKKILLSLTPAVAIIPIASVVACGNSSVQYPNTKLMSSLLNQLSSFNIDQDLSGITNESNFSGTLRSSIINTIKSQIKSGSSANWEEDTFREVKFSFNLRKADKQILYIEVNANHRNKILTKLVPVIGKDPITTEIDLLLNNLNQDDSDFSLSDDISHVKTKEDFNGLTNNSFLTILKNKIKGLSNINWNVNNFNGIEFEFNLTNVFRDYVEFIDENNNKAQVQKQSLTINVVGSKNNKSSSKSVTFYGTPDSEIEVIWDELRALQTASILADFSTLAADANFSDLPSKVLDEFERQITNTISGSWDQTFNRITFTFELVKHENQKIWIKVMGEQNGKTDYRVIQLNGEDSIVVEITESFKNVGDKLVFTDDTDLSVIKSLSDFMTNTSLRNKIIDLIKAEINNITSNGISYKFDLVGLEHFGVKIRVTGTKSLRSASHIVTIKSKQELIDVKDSLDKVKNTTIEYDLSSIVDESTFIEPGSKWIIDAIKTQIADDPLISWDETNPNIYNEVEFDFTHVSSRGQEITIKVKATKNSYYEEKQVKVLGKEVIPVPAN